MSVLIKYSSYNGTSVTLALAGDLYNATSLENITQWHIFEQAFTKSDFIKILKNEARSTLEGLDKAKLGQLLGYNSIKIQTSSKNQLVDDLIENLDISSNFNTIFP